eukprot:1181631-Prorocentrum_minimum.AAC.3
MCRPYAGRPKSKPQRLMCNELCDIVLRRENSLSRGRVGTSLTRIPGGGRRKSSVGSRDYVGGSDRRRGFQQKRLYLPFRNGHGMVAITIYGDWRLHVCTIEATRPAPHIESSGPFWILGFRV